LEFLLAAPLLLLFFFGILQLTYMASVAFALQRSAFDLARQAAITGTREGPELRSRLWSHLAPLGTLAPEAAVAIAASEFECRDSADGSWVTARVRYPMPLWVPGLGSVFGRPFTPPPHPPGRREAWERFSRTASFPLPSLPLVRDRRFPVRWMTAESTVHHEGNGWKAAP
jgi:hypothetical protein